MRILIVLAVLLALIFLLDLSWWWLLGPVIAVFMLCLLMVLVLFLGAVLVDRNTKRKKMRADTAGTGVQPPKRRTIRLGTWILPGVVLAVAASPLVAKATGLVNWPWVWTTGPLWGGMAAGGVLALTARFTAGRKPGVFVSYRMKEHTDYATDLARLLEEQGFSVWFDKTASRGRMSPWLHQWLRRAIQTNDIMLFLIPQEEPETELPKSLRKLARDWIISAPRWIKWWKLHGAEFRRARKSLLNNFFEHVRNAWYRATLGVPLGKMSWENWHTWERRVGEATGSKIVVLDIVSVDRGPTSLTEGAVVLRSDQLEQDVCDRLLQVLIRDREEMALIRRRAYREVNWFNRFAFGVLSLVAVAAILIVGTMWLILWPFQAAAEKFEAWRRPRKQEKALRE